MSTRIPALLTAGLCVAALGAAAGPAAARHDADDPAGHVRQSRGADDAASSSDDRRARDRRRAHRRHRGRHHAAAHRGAHRHGADDGPNHR